MIPGRLKLWALVILAGALSVAALVARIFRRGIDQGKREAKDEGIEFDQGRAADLRRRVDAARGRVYDQQSDKRGYRD